MSLMFHYLIMGQMCSNVLLKLISLKVIILLRLEMPPDKNRRWLGTVRIEQDWSDPSTGGEPRRNTSEWNQHYARGDLISNPRYLSVLFSNWNTMLMPLENVHTCFRVFITNGPGTGHDEWYTTCVWNTKLKGDRVAGWEREFGRILRVGGLALAQVTWRRGWGVRCRCGNSRLYQRWADEVGT